MHEDQEIDLHTHTSNVFFHFWEKKIKTPNFNRFGTLIIYRCVCLCVYFDDFVIYLLFTWKIVKFLLQINTISTHTHHTNALGSVHISHITFILAAAHAAAAVQKSNWIPSFGNLVWLWRRWRQQQRLHPKPTFHNSQFQSISHTLLSLSLFIFFYSFHLLRLLLLVLLLFDLKLCLWNLFIFF